MTPDMIDLLLSPFAQDHAYHAFADTRTLLGIPNIWNVGSNLAFLVVGLWGLVFVVRHNASLGWDRLAMTIGIMGSHALKHLFAALAAASLLLGLYRRRNALTAGH